MIIFIYRYDKYITYYYLYYNIQKLFINNKNIVFLILYFNIVNIVFIYIYIYINYIYILFLIFLYYKLL